MSHLVALAGGWSLWTWACLRAPGFPAALVLELADGELAAAADRRLAREAEEGQHREALVAAYKAAAERGSPDERRAIQHALRPLWQDKLPAVIGDAAADAVRASYLAARMHAADAMREVGVEHARAARASSLALRRLAEDDRLRQAMLWQNPSAVQAGVASLLRQPPGATDSKTRNKERLVASYLQRYCVKNDTIGFFGPCGWARFVDQAIAITEAPGPALLANRTVYFEYWGIDALAHRLSTDPAVRPWIAPRLLPGCRLDGATLHFPIARSAVLPADFAAVAARCDGERTARAIARDVAGEPELATEAAVFAILDELVAERVIHWELEIPTATPQPELHLARLLDRIEPEADRRRARELLGGLERGRAVVAACRDAPALEAALGAFDAVFTAATGVRSERAHGETYAGRTPLYEECRRDLDVALGRPIVDKLAPLALVLASARWYTHEIATRYRSALVALHERMRGPGDPVVDLSPFWQEVLPLFDGAIVGEVRDELRRRWAAILAIDPAESIVERRAAALAGEVERAFAAPGPGWPAARHHSPDILIAAAGPDAIARGAFRIVLGELHTGFNTIAGPFLKLHPDRDALVAARDADLDRVCIAPVWTKAITGADYFSPSPHDLDLENGETRSSRPPAQVVRQADLVVEAAGPTLVVATRDGAHRFEIIAFLEHHLIAESYAGFSLVAPAPRSPRIAIDDVVIARASWQITPADLGWPALDDAAARFVAARRWARSLDLPRWVFVRTPEEIKPVYADLDSPIYVDLLAKQLRAASAATISEMLPAADDTWVLDRTGARYTSELRIVAVDPVRYVAPGAR